MIKLYTTDDHAMLTDWWTTHKWPCLPKEALPSAGYISYINDKPTLAGFLYIDPSAKMMGWVEWIVSNPESTFEERNQAWIELMAKIEEVAKENEMKMIFTVSHNEKYIKRMGSFNYTVTGTTCTQMMKFL